MTVLINSQQLPRCSVREPVSDVWRNNCTWESKPTAKVLDGRWKAIPFGDWREKENEDSWDWAFHERGCSESQDAAGDPEWLIWVKTSGVRGGYTGCRRYLTILDVGVGVIERRSEEDFVFVVQHQKDLVLARISVGMCSMLYILIAKWGSLYINEWNLLWDTFTFEGFDPFHSALDREPFQPRRRISVAPRSKVFHCWESTYERRDDIR